MCGQAHGALSQTAEFGSYVVFGYRKLCENESEHAYICKTIMWLVQKFSRFVAPSIDIALCI